MMWFLLVKIIVSIAAILFAVCAGIQFEKLKDEVPRTRSSRERKTVSILALVFSVITMIGVWNL